MGRSPQRRPAPTAAIATVSRCSTSSTSPSASPAAATVSTPPRMAPADAASTIAREPASVHTTRLGTRTTRAVTDSTRTALASRRPEAARAVVPGRGLALHPGWGEQEVAALVSTTPNPASTARFARTAPAPAAPHPEGHDDRRQQPDPERAGQLLELGRLRDGDEVRVEVLGEDRPGPDREQDDGDRQDHDQRQDDAQALGAAGGRRHAGPGARPPRSASGRGRPAPGSSRR